MIFMHTTPEPQEAPTMSTTPLSPATESLLRALVEDPAAYLEVCEAEAAAFAEAFPTVRTGERHTTGWAACHPLTISQVGYGIPPAGLSDEEVLSWIRTAPVRGAVLTEDGRAAHTSVWHTGAPTGESVYFEVWTEGSRNLHGFVDPTSRRVVQYG